MTTSLQNDMLAQWMRKIDDLIDSIDLGPDRFVTDFKVSLRSDLSGVVTLCIAPREADARSRVLASLHAIEREIEFDNLPDLESKLKKANFVSKHPEMTNG